MAVVEQRVIGGVVRATWDDATELYREFGTDGATLTLSRAYTPVELEQKAERVARNTAHANAATYRQQISDGIAALQADVVTLQGVAGVANATINANPANYIKPMAALLVRLENSVIYLGRIVSNSLN